MRLGYLYSRYPVISQTFCDAEMLALERLGFDLVIGSVYPPLTSLRHEYLARLRAPVHYAPPQEILKIRARTAKRAGQWPGALVAAHEEKYGPAFKAEQRARNALYFAELFSRRGIEHVHVHFANRAAHTAMFVREISGIPFSVTAHGQDFMKDLGNIDLLREICAEAEFVAAETDYSCGMLRQLCPEAASKIHRVYNGFDLARLARRGGQDCTSGAQEKNPLRILSVGRLVAFKGFDCLIDACAALVRSGLDFTCEIIGDGPLRGELQSRIEKKNLSGRVQLLGALSEAAVLEKVAAADIFALASVIDAQGASDVFPTVIIEAMAAGRPVVSTRLAGIPEAVADGETGLLVPPGDPAALATALERLMRDAELRRQLGRAGRARVEQHFQIDQTVRPLIRLFEKTARSSHKPQSLSKFKADASQGVAYLIDCWPDEELPGLERELEEMLRRKISLFAVVCEFDSSARRTREMERLAPRLEFLPDPMVLEGEWRANPALARRLEEERAQNEARLPAGIFLRQARFALALRRLLSDRKVTHIHATSSRALVCALILQDLLGTGVSATIERRPQLPRNWLAFALKKCRGGRISNPKLLSACPGSFLLDKAALFSGLQKVVRSVERKTGIDLPRMRSRAGFWNQWLRLLARWSSDGESAEASRANN